MEKSVPSDHCLSSLGKPRDAKRQSLGQIFLSYPHPHDRYYLIFCLLVMAIELLLQNQAIMKMGSLAVG